MTAYSAFFHDDSASVRFWVQVGDHLIGASVGKSTLHYRYQPHRSDDDPMATYREHMPALHAAVHRRVAAGSREPVMLRENDLHVPATSISALTAPPSTAPGR